jgi:ferritin-like metal-binding protein YciE
MATKTPKDVFVALLSNARQNTERTTGLFKEMSQLVEDPDAKEGLESRVFVSDKVLSQIDQCFKLLGEQPVKVASQAQDALAEEFRKELADIQSPPARRFFVLTKAIQFTHLRIAEFLALTAAADLTGHFGIGVLLESCLADTLVFVERTRRLIRMLIEGKLAEKLAA